MVRVGIEGQVAPRGCTFELALEQATSSASERGVVTMIHALLQHRVVPMRPSGDHATVGVDAIVQSGCVPVLAAALAHGGTPSGATGSDAQAAVSSRSQDALKSVMQQSAEATIQLAELLERRDECASAAHPPRRKTLAARNTHPSLSTIELQLVAARVVAQNATAALRGSSATRT